MSTSCSSRCPRPSRNVSPRPATGRRSATVDACPALAGARRWHPPASRDIGRTARLDASGARAALLWCRPPRWWREAKDRCLEDPRRDTGVAQPLRRRMRRRRCRAPRGSSTSRPPGRGRDGTWCSARSASWPAARRARCWRCAPSRRARRPSRAWHRRARPRRAWHRRRRTPPRCPHRPARHRRRHRLGRPTHRPRYPPRHRRFAILTRSSSLRSRTCSRASARGPTSIRRVDAPSLPTSVSRPSIPGGAACVSSAGTSRPIRSPASSRTAPMAPRGPSMTSCRGHSAPRSPS